MSDETTGIAVVAGGGPLPGALARTLAGDGRRVFVVALKGVTEPATVEGFPHMWTRMGAAGAIIRRLHAERVAEVVFAGPVKRPSLLELMPDWRTAAFIARVGVRAMGDDGLLRAVAAELEEREGFRLRGYHEFIGEDVAPVGPIGRITPDTVASADIARGIEVARGVGLLDVGQGCVVQQGIVLAVEAVEGTDAMLERCRDLARPGPGGVLVKTVKPQQDRRLDLPTIGPVTVERAFAAGLRGVAIEAGGGLIVDRRATAETADRLGLFVVGVRVSP